MVNPQPHFCRHVQTSHASFQSPPPETVDDRGTCHARWHLVRCLDRCERGITTPPSCTRVVVEVHGKLCSVGMVDQSSYPSGFSDCHFQALSHMSWSFRF